MLRVAVEEDDLLAAVKRVLQHDAVLVRVALERELPRHAALGGLDHAPDVLELIVDAQRTREAPALLLRHGEKCRAQAADHTSDHNSGGAYL